MMISYACEGFRGYYWTPYAWSARQPLARLRW